MLASQTAFSQQISFEVVTGTNLTKDFQVPEGPNAKSGSSRFIIGPMMEVEVGISRDFSVEVNALHRDLKLDYTLPLPFPFENILPIRAKTGTWQFPVLAKYRIPMQGPRLFVEAGPSFRTVPVYSAPGRPTTNLRLAEEWRCAGAA